MLMLMAHPSLQNEGPYPHFLSFFRFQFHLSGFLQKPFSLSLFARYIPLSLSLSVLVKFLICGFFFVTGSLSLSTVQRRGVVVCETAPKQKVDSAVKRARQAEKRRIYNKARKSEIRTRTKKVFIKLC